MQECLLRLGSRVYNSELSAQKTFQQFSLALNQLLEELSTVVSMCLGIYEVNK